MTLTNWTWFICWVAAEVAVLIAGAGIVHLFFRSPQAKKIIWQTAMASVALLLVVEVSGLRDRMPSWHVKQHRHWILTASVVPPVAPVPQNRDVPMGSVTAAAPAPAVVNWPGWLWLSGMALLLTRSFAARLWLCLRRRQALPADEESLRLLEPLQRSMRLRSVKPQVWPDLRSPIAFGVFRPTIALPRDFAARFSSSERHVMLAHEMAHLAARDPFWLLVSDIVIAVAWWHPLAWWARRRLQAASEAAADEASTLIPGGPCALAECLVRVGRELTASGPMRSLGVAGNGPQSELAMRIARLLRLSSAWQPSTVWGRLMPHISAIFVALASAALPIQTGISYSIVALLSAPVSLHAERPLTTKISTNTSTTVAAVTSVPSKNVVVTSVEVKSNATFNVVANGTAPLTYQWHSETNAPGSNVVVTSEWDVGGLTFRASQKGTAPFSYQYYVNGKPLGKKPPPQDGPKVKLVVQAVAMTEHESDQIGLDWIFGLAPTNNPTVEVSHDWNALEISSRRETNSHPKNVEVDKLHTEGQGVVLSAAQFAALLDRILAATGDDVLSAPTITTVSGRQTRISTLEMETIVDGVVATDVSPTNAAGINYLTDNVGSGFAVDAIPTAEDDGNWRLAVVGSVTTFLGYDTPGKILSVSKIGYVMPLPHFRVVETTAEEVVPLGQTLAIRGPLWVETTKTKGHFFSRSKTKTTRQRLYIFVTPTSP